MKHFPIFLAVEGRRIVISGGGEAAVAKLRLLMKTEAHLTVIADDVAPEIDGWARDGHLTILRRAQEPGD
ncbi:MAG: NAD(P)-dependent oxidoreductase, partial [Pseudomonadota bacterium]